MNLELKVVTPDRIEECAEVIRTSFLTVAEDFKLTKENAPTNPAYIKADALQKMREKQVDLFAACLGDKIIGFVAVEKAKTGIYYMEKLAVLPEYRHNGMGTKLMDFVTDYVREKGGGKISIGIIDENRILKNWYLAYGFCETQTKVFAHLPFAVCLMEKTVDAREHATVM